MLFVYSKLNDIEKQVKLSKKVIKLYPDEKFGYDSLALLYIKNNDVKAAYNIVTELKFKFPNNNNCNYYLGLLEELQNNYKKARQYFKYAFRDNPNSNDISFSLALNYENSNEYIYSDSLFSIFLGSNPSPSDKNDYAYILSQRDTIDRDKLFDLLDIALEALESRPDKVEFLDTVGYIYYRLGNINMAIYYYELCLVYDDTNIIILSHLLDAYYRVKNFVKAKEIHFKIKSIDSEFEFEENIKYYVK